MIFWEAVSCALAGVVAGVCFGYGWSLLRIDKDRLSLVELIHDIEKNVQERILTLEWDVKQLDAQCLEEFQAGYAMGCLDNGNRSPIPKEILARRFNDNKRKIK